MITAQILVGQFDEPFLEAALRSVEGWVDAFSVVNTHPDTPGGRENRAKVLSAVPTNKLRYAEYHPGDEGFSFATARNLGLSMVDASDSQPFVLWLDADDIHTPEAGAIFHQLLADGADSVWAHFMHFVVYRDAVQAVFPREVIYRLTPETEWVGRVHERLHTPRHRQAWAEYRWFHASYIRGQRNVFDRWRFYSQLEGDFHHYDGQNPDTIISDRVSVARRLEMEWPSIATEALEGVPFCPHELGDERPSPPPKIGFVIIQRQDDPADSVAHATFHETTKGAAELLIVNGDHTSLCRSLNEGFADLRDRGFDFIGWIHPDMRFTDPGWLDGLLTEFRCWPNIGKACAANLRDPIPPTMIDAHEQCYLLRRLVLDEIGLFDEGYRGIGGYEDWDMNRRIINAGWRVVLTPRSLVYHVGMATRSQRDTTADQVANGHYYATKWGTYDAPV